ncbi:MAG TPA: pyrroline-5-carboxylate reductase [Pseudonocardia sp.]|jgi:pyrroline-5-carboxylate reductase|nr:pyrroline-5-carboxylate reductase [Pseudonocardia sp.]
MTSIAVFGAGKIGEALLGGLVKAGQPNDELCFTERYPNRRREVSERLGVRQVTVAEAASTADLLVIAVKPQDIDPLLAELAATMRPGAVVVSLCAGLPTALFERRLGDGVAVVRVMPNTPMVVGEAMSAISPGTHADESALVEVERMLGTVGRVVRVPEHQQDAVTALSGSGPAYFFYLVEAMIEAGVLLGMPRELASDLVVQSALGAARMLRDSGEHPVVLREAVTSPGGTTAVALRELDRHGTRTALAAAIVAAHDRSSELGSAHAE